jgi:hypothetical protein
MLTATRRRLLGPVAVIGVLAGMMVAAPTADATIVIGQSIAGVKLGDTASEVKAAMRSQSPEHPPFFHSEIFYSEYMRVFFKHGQVDKVLLYSKQQKTTKGITIASSRAQLKSAYPGAQCTEGAGPPAYFYCVMAGHAQGRKSYTGFLFEATGGIVEIELGYGSVAHGLSEP